MAECTALWFGASGFEVLSAARATDVEVTISVQTIAAAVGCSGCGVRAVAKDRRWVILRDAPAGHRVVDYDDVSDAAEAVQTASLLMRILDRVETRERDAPLATRARSEGSAPCSPLERKR